MTSEKQLQPVNQTGYQARNIWISSPTSPTPQTRLRFKSMPLSLTQPQINSVTSRLRYGKIIFNTPTFKSVDEILWSYHSNDTSWAELLDSNIHFSVF